MGLGIKYKFRSKINVVHPDLSSKWVIRAQKSGLSNWTDLMGVQYLAFWGTTKQLPSTSFFDIPVVPAPFVQLSLFLGSHSFPTVSQCGIWTPMSWPCLPPWPHFPHHTVTGNCVIPKDLKFWTSSSFWPPCFYLCCSLLPEMPAFHLSLNELLRSSEQPQALRWKFYWTQIPLTFLLLPLN